MSWVGGLGTGRLLSMQAHRGRGRGRGRRPAGWRSWPIPDPHRRAPGELAVLLLDADVVIARARLRRAVHPGHIHVRLAGSGGVDDLVVLHHDHPGDGTGADGPDA